MTVEYIRGKNPIPFSRIFPDEDKRIQSPGNVLLGLLYLTEWNVAQLGITRHINGISSFTFL